MPLAEMFKGIAVAHGAAHVSLTHRLAKDDAPAVLSNVRAAVMIFHFCLSSNSVRILHRT